MNKDRRKAIQGISDEISELRERIEALLEEEQEYYDNMPEAFQDGEKGEATQSHIENLEGAVNASSELEELLNNCL